MASLTEKSIPDLNSTDHMIAITQLREELEALKKQIQGKDQQMKEKEMKVQKYHVDGVYYDQRVGNNVFLITTIHKAQVQFQPLLGIL